MPYEKNACIDKLPSGMSYSAVSCEFTVTELARMFFTILGGGSHSAHYNGCLLAVVRTSQGQGTGLGNPMKVLVTQSCPTL